MADSGSPTLAARRVHIEHNLGGRLDAAIGLMRAASPFNFTGRRLPAEREKARASLLGDTRIWTRHAALVRLADEGGGEPDVVGFFHTKMGRVGRRDGAAHRTLIDFCFADRPECARLAPWLYGWLGRPELEAGKAAAALEAPVPPEEFTLVEGPEGTAPVRLAEEIRLCGGCEAPALDIYLQSNCARFRQWGNVRVGEVLLRVNSPAFVLTGRRAGREAVAAEAAALGLPAELLPTDYLVDAPRNTLFLFNGALDRADAPSRFRRRSDGWEFAASPLGRTLTDLDGAADAPPAPIQAGQGDLARIRERTDTLYDRVGPTTDAERIAAMRELIEAIPSGGRLIVLLYHDRTRDKGGPVVPQPQVGRYNAAMQKLVDHAPYARFLSFSEVVKDDAEVLPGANHYARMVYARMAALIRRTARSMPARV
jgi:hypothetical protein